MDKIQIWKFKRELRRIWRQLFWLPISVYDKYFATEYYDYLLRAKNEITEGLRPLGRKACVYLVYPSQAILESHLLTINQLNISGYSVLVVSNRRLSENDRSKLKDVSWRIIERLNLGYDFGGYRDGILYCETYFRTFDRFVLLNDSTWVITDNFASWLSEAESGGVDFVGSSSSSGSDRFPLDSHGSVVWKYSPDSRDFHYGSFALSFSSRVINDKAFTEFWKGMRLSNEKKDMIRRGEIGLTDWIKESGFTHSSTYNVNALEADIEKLSDQEVFEIAKGLLVFNKKKYQNFWREVMYNKSSTREDYKNLILIIVSHQGAAYALAGYLITQKGFPFLKKLLITQPGGPSEALLDFALTIEGPYGDVIRREMAALLQKRHPAHYRQFCERLGSSKV
jgi:Rhamnan synthesis protein F